MFKYFENLIDLFEDIEFDVLLKGFWVFCWYYIKLVWFIFVVVLVFGVLIVIFEVVIFIFFGDLVNWFVMEDVQIFFVDNWGYLFWMGIVIFILFFVVLGIWEIVFYQGLMGIYFMLICWWVYCYLLCQSVVFYQNDFVGCIVNKLMQIVLVVWEVVMWIVDIFVYVIVYFMVVLFVVVEVSFWFVILLLVWLVGYLVIIRLFILRFKNVLWDQVDVWLVMIGYVVDVYINIFMVKLFFYVVCEEMYVKILMFDFLKIVFLQMWLVFGMNIILIIFNMVLLFLVVSLLIGFWQKFLVLIGEIVVVVVLVLCIQGMF